LSALITLGNDVVDLTERYNKAPSLRFIQRVCCAQERSELSASHRPVFLLWKIWTAKEAAYKAVVKKFPNTLFAHKDFKVDLVTHSVFLGKEQIFVQWQYPKNAIHCVAIFIDRELTNLHKNSRARKKVFCNVLKKTSRTTKHSPLRSSESSTVRLLALKLLTCSKKYKNLSKTVKTSVVIKRDTSSGRALAPYFYRGSVLLDRIELSLSHDGRFTSAAVLFL